MSMEREVSSRSVDNEKNEIARALVDGILMIVQSSPALDQFKGGLEDLRHTLSGERTVEVPPPDPIDEPIDEHVEQHASDSEASEKSITDGYVRQEVEVKSEMLAEEQQTVDVQPTTQFEDSDSELHIPIAKRRRVHEPKTTLADSRLVDALTQAMTPLFEGLGREIAKLRVSVEMGYLQAGLGKPVGPFGQARSAPFSASPQQNDPDDSAINQNQ
ncbi:hypothetical protein FRC17_011171 [Serendipita sp. 399]|nr:hypothetical protein FRC17_011171 [Serendipita sp. 399]